MTDKYALRLGDCLQYMRGMAAGSVDAVITDPPYGIGAGREKPHNGWRDLGISDWDLKRIEKKYFDEMLRISSKVIVWGGNYYSDYLPPSQQWLIWDKGQRDFSLADGELAWSNQDKAVRIFSYSRGAMQKERVEHPTQKPIALMKWCIELLDAETVFDPFMGSGTTGVACMQLGRRFIGCEINEQYFDIARKRIEAAAMQEPLFV